MVLVNVWVLCMRLLVLCASISVNVFVVIVRCPSLRVLKQVVYLVSLGVTVVMIL